MNFLPAQIREGQHKSDTTKRWVTINFTACRGRVTFLAGRFYIHAHRDSSGPPPPPLLQNECSLIVTKKGDVYLYPRKRILFSVKEGKF